MPKIHEKYQCPDLESKNESNEFFKQNNVPTTFVVLSYYFDNYYTAGAPIANGDGTYSVYMNMGDANLSAMSVKDIGICVSSIFDNKKYIGEHINLSGEFLKIETLCQLLSKKLNKQITYVPMSNDDYRAQEFPGAIDIGNMYQYYTECADIIQRNTDMSLVKKLNPKMQTFEAFLDEFSQKFQLDGEPKQIIGVHGATGNQGSSIVDALLEEGKFQVRAFTRNKNSEKAKELEQKGAQVVQMDQNDYQSILQAYEGCYGIFGVTSYWMHKQPNIDVQQGIYMAKAAKEQNIKHYIWSTLTDTKKYVKNLPLTNGYQCPDMETKADCDKYFEQYKVPTTYMNLPFYWDNFAGHNPATKIDENVWSHYFSLGKNASISGMAVKDIGKCVRGIFNNFDTTINQYINIASEFLTADQMCETITKHTQKTTVNTHISYEDTRKQGWEGCVEWANMQEYTTENEQQIRKWIDLEYCKKLNPEMITFDQFCQEFKNKFVYQ